MKLIDILQVCGSGLFKYSLVTCFENSHTHTKMEIFDLRSWYGEQRKHWVFEVLSEWVLLSRAWPCQVPQDLDSWENGPAFNGVGSVKSQSSLPV